MKRAVYRYGGDSDDYRPKTILKTLEMTLDGKSVEIPPSAYSDLGDPSIENPHVEVNEASVVVTIFGGGDGWTPYRAELLIKDSRVAKRSVFNVMQELVFGKVYKPDTVTY